MAPQNWIFSVSPENWDTVKSRQIFAVKGDRSRGKVHNEDRLLVYISSTYSVGGIFKIVGDWYEVRQPQFSDELKAGKVLYPFVVNVKKEAIGVADIRQIKGALSFIENKKYWSTYFQQNPGNHGRSISEEDYYLILQELKRNPEEWHVETSIPIEAPIQGKAWVSFASPSGGGETHTSVSLTFDTVEERNQSQWKHVEIINRMMTIGEVFGFKSSKEPSVNDIRPHGKVFASKEKQLDVGWDMGIGVWIPIEVQVHGKVSDLMYRLNLVHQWSHRMIVIAEGRDYEEVKEASKTFPFQDKIVLLQPEEVLKTSESLDGLKSLRRKIFE